MPQFQPVDYDPFADSEDQVGEAGGEAFAKAGQAIAGDVGDITSGLAQTAAIPGDVYQGKYQPGTPEFEGAARQFASTFGQGVAPGGSLAAGVARRALGAGPEAAAAGGGLLRNADLDTLLPVADRRVGPYQEGVGTVPVAGGDNWSDLDMSKPIGGMKASPEDLTNAWNDAVDTVKSWSPEQADALDKYLADNPEVGPNTPKFWNDALSQTDKERYWYERGTRKFQDEGLGEHPEDMRDVMNVAAATSPSAEPLQNLQRTMGVMAEHQQGLPISTDLIQPGAVRMALTTGMEAPKTTNYTGTFLHIAGVDDKAPLSVNDRQMGEIFGIAPEVLAKRPDLYALTSKFTQNLRDAENAARPGVADGSENPFESWQIQAPAWAQWRGMKSAAKVGQSDDYADVIDNHIRPQLEAAGIDTSPGLFSPQVLGHPDTPNVMSATRQQYLASPTATMETATTMTPEGQRASDLLSRLPPPGPDSPSWANNARYQMERVQRNSMAALTSGDKNSVFSQLVAPVVGDPSAAVSRADTTGWGTYQGDINPNLRVPMWASTKAGRVTLSPDQIRPVLSAIGDAFGQDGVAASHFEGVEPDADTGGRPRTYSMFLPGPQASTGQLQQFRQALGHEISVRQAPNGTQVDIHPSFETGLPPSYDQVAGAANGVFNQGQPIHISDRAYTSYYLEHPSQNPAANYGTHIDDFWKGQSDGDNNAGGTGGVGAANWPASQRASDFEDARQKARAIAADQQTRTQQWSDQWEPRIQKWEQNPAGRGRQLRPLAPPAVPSPAFIPVDHDPFASLGASP